MACFLLGWCHFHLALRVAVTSQAEDGRVRLVRSVGAASTFDDAGAEANKNRFVYCQKRKLARGCAAVHPHRTDVDFSPWRDRVPSSETTFQRPAPLRNVVASIGSASTAPGLVYFRSFHSLNACFTSQRLSEEG
jgi:hypothetical protein